MNISLLFIPILMWSFVGVLVKISVVSFSSGLISFFRFFFGVLALGVYYIVKGKRPKLVFSQRWIWIAALAKTGNYVLENIAIAHGASWGYIVEQPVQAIALLLISTFYFREGLGKRKVFAAFLCVFGVSLVGLRGLATVNSGGVGDFVLFAIAACCAAVHFTSQKVLLTSMSSGDMNMSVFIVASGLSALPLPAFTPLVIAPPTAGAILASVVLGCITGVSFLIWGAVSIRVPFMVSGVLANSLGVFALIWGVLLRGELVSPWALAGTVVFITGLIVMNLPNRRVVRSSG